MGGTKRKLPIEKIEKKSSRAVCFTKRRTGLYSKASELCLLSGAQMAILTTPLSSKSHVSFYSFGHSSVDGVVDSFLKDHRLVQENNIVGYTSREENLGLGFWWEDESLAKSEKAEELSGAIDSISRMLRDLKELRMNNQDYVVKNEIKKRSLVLHERQKLDRTLNLQSSSATFGIPDDRFKRETEIVVFDDQVISENTDNPARNLDDGYNNQDPDLDQLIDYGCLFDVEFETNQEHPDTAETSLLMKSEMGNVSTVTTNPNMCSDFEAVEDEAFGASQRFG